MLAMLQLLVSIFLSAQYARQTLLMTWSTPSVPVSTSFENLAGHFASVSSSLEACKSFSHCHGSLVPHRCGGHAQKLLLLISPEMESLALFSDLQELQLPSLPDWPISPYQSVVSF
jgi:hypothetical protein